MSFGVTGATIFGCSGPVLTGDERAFFRDADPWGFILFARNVETPDQLRRLTGDLRDSVGRDAAVLVDQEGGRVQRLRAPHWREWKPPIEEQIPRALWLRYRIICAELLAVGIDVNCAPCLDIAYPQTHPFLRNRCLGEEHSIVAQFGTMVVDAHKAGGVLPVMKHVPGHGLAVNDSHKELPVVLSDPMTLSSDRFPFSALASQVALAMTSHVLYPQIDRENPATHSATIIGMIRDEIGFDGLLMTDDLNMEALGGDLFYRAEKALAAGCDVVLQCNGDLGQMQQVAKAAGRMTDLARKRGDVALSQRRPPEPCDLDALIAEYDSLYGSAHGG